MESLFASNTEQRSLKQKFLLSDIVSSEPSEFPLHKYSYFLQVQKPTMLSGHFCASLNEITFSMPTFQYLRTACDESFFSEVSDAFPLRFPSLRHSLLCTGWVIKSGCFDSPVMFLCIVSWFLYLKFVIWINVLPPKLQASREEQRSLCLQRWYPVIL